MSEVLKLQTFEITNTESLADLPFNHEKYFRLGLLATKHLVEEFGPVAPLVDHLLSQEICQSDLRLKTLDTQLKYEELSLKCTKLTSENERLIEVSNRDPLTGLFNRRGAEAAYSRLINLAKRENDRRQQSGLEQAESQILVIDIDDFKQTNDTHGHGAGDELLNMIAEVMTANTRQDHIIPDIISRIGGDEFLILMYGAPRHIADDAANAIRDEVEDLGRDNVFLESSVSIGVGAVDLNLSLKETVDLADQALLQAKQNGKNMVVHFDDMSGEV